MAKRCGVCAKQKAWSQEKLAEKAGCHKKTIDRAERGVGIYASNLEIIAFCRLSGVAFIGALLESPQARRSLRHTSEDRLSLVIITPGRTTVSGQSYAATTR